MHFSKEAFWERNMAEKILPLRKTACASVFSMLVSSPHPVLLAVLEPDLDPFREILSPGFHSLNTVGPDLQQNLSPWQQLLNHQEPESFGTILVSCE